MSQASEGDSPFSARVVAVLITIAVIAFGGVMVLAGWSPELRDRNRAGDHPYSTSAIGYAGLVRLLEAQDYPVSISRLDRNMESRDWGLMIVTIPSHMRLTEFDETPIQLPALLVMPKWAGRADPFDPTRQADTRFLDASGLNDRLRQIYPDAEIIRISPEAELGGAFDAREIRADVRLQMIKSDSLETIIGDERGALVSYDPVRGVYILSDPDLVNTFGLARLENAVFATNLINYLRSSPNEPILLDATLHGFSRSENLLKMLFSAPYIGATLVALAAALLLGWAAIVRFGPPAREGRAIALGKQALADNSAGLITMARRETRMAPGYANLIRRRLARALGLPRSLPENQLTEIFDRLGPVEEGGRVFSELETAIKGQIANREGLVTKARDLHHWRKEIIRRTMHERG